MPIRLGVVGCGRHGVDSHIVPGLQAGFVLSAIYDPSEESIQKALEAAGSDGVRICVSAKELVQRRDVDVVVITSEDRFHPRQLLQAVLASKHVLVDKPLAITRPAMLVVRLALAIAARRGLIVMSCHPRRFDPPYEWIKANLGQLTERFGELVHVGLDFSYTEPKHQWKLARSLLLDHFPHEIDLLRWLLGDVAFRAYRLSDGPFGYCVAGRSASGATFLFAGTRKLRAPKLFPEEIRLRFARGECLVNTKAGEAKLHDHEKQEWTTEQVPPTDYDRRFLAVMRNLAEAVQGLNPSYLTLRDLLVNNDSANKLRWRGRYRYRAPR